MLPLEKFYNLYVILSKRDHTEMIKSRKCQIPSARKYLCANIYTYI